MSAPDHAAARDDLERALLQIDCIAAVLASMGDPSEKAVEWLAEQLQIERDAAHDAFSRIFNLDKYREQAALACRPPPG